jgi:hypothetical protein
MNDDNKVYPDVFQRDIRPSWACQLNIDTLKTDYRSCHSVGFGLKEEKLPLIAIDVAGRK